MSPARVSSDAESSQITASDKLRAYRYSLLEIPFGTLFRNSVTMAALVALALWMQAGPIELGILASLPFLSNAISLFASKAAAVTGSPRRLTIWGFSLMTALYGILPALVVMGIALPESLPRLRLILIAVVALAEMATALASVAYFAWAAELFGPLERMRYYSRRLMVTSAANIITALAIGQYLSIWGLGREINPVAFYTLIPAGMLSMALAIWFIRLIPAGKAPHLAAAHPGRSQLLEPLRDPNYRGFIFARALQAVAYQIGGPFFTVFLAVDLKLSYSWIFGLQVMYQLASIVGYRFWERVSGRIGARQVFLINAVLFAFFPGLFALAGIGGLWLLIPLQLYGISEGGYLLSSFVLLMNLAPEKRHVAYIGTANAVVGTLFGLSSIAGGLLVAPLAGIPAISELSPIGSGIPALMVLGALLRFIILPGLWSVRDVPARLQPS